MPNNTNKTKKNWTNFDLTTDSLNVTFYKTITSQNVPSEAQIKNAFVSQKGDVPFSRY